MNLFSFTEDMKIYIYIYIYWWSSSRRNKIKKKFAEEAGNWMGYCLFSSMSHDTMDCIVTQGAGACYKGATIWPGGLVTRPHDTASKAITRLGRAQGIVVARACMACQG